MMKKTWKNIFRHVTMVALLIGFMPELSEAQILKRITKRVGEKIEREATRRADRKVDQAINKGFDKVEEGLEGNNNNKQDTKQAASSSNMAAQMEALMGGLSADVKLKDTYDFRIGVTYEMRTPEDEGGGESTTMAMWFANEPYVGSEVEQGNDRMISVIDDGQIIMFNDTDKSYMAISSQSLGAFSQAAKDAVGDQELVDEDLGEVTMKRLGSENILGYTCQGYEFSTDAATTRIWYTEELNVNMFAAFLGSMGTLLNHTTSELPKEAMDVNGVMMRMESHDKTTGDRMIMEAKQVHTQGKTIVSSDYKRMGLN